ncbi:hypothetical protein JCM17092_23150 [Haloplanus litoreus]
MPNYVTVAEGRLQMLAVDQPSGDVLPSRRGENTRRILVVGRREDFAGRTLQDVQTRFGLVDIEVLVVTSA